MTQRTKLYIKNKGGRRTHLIIFKGNMNQYQIEGLAKGIQKINEARVLPAIIPVFVPENITAQIIKL